MFDPWINLFLHNMTNKILSLKIPNFQESLSVFNANNKYSNVSTDALLTEMLKCTQVYKKIRSCVEDLNDVYGFSLLLNFTHDFTLITTQIFCMLYMGSNLEWETVRTAILVISVFLLPNILKISLICFVCHVTRNAVRSDCDWKWRILQFQRDILLLLFEELNFPILNKFWTIPRAQF